MSLRAIAVTAADQAYADLALDLLASLAPHREMLRLEVGLLDLGLAPEGKAKLASSATHVVVPPWPFRPHARFDSVMKWRSRTARPFLRDLFPGYDLYVWLDADCFVQSALGLKWLLDVASQGAAAVVPAVDRSYVHHPRQVEWLRQRYRMAFDAETTGRLMQVPYINAGVFAFGAGSPVWDAWARRFQAALERWDGDYLSDQAVLNGTLVLDRVPHARLPAICNWICHLALPRWLSRQRVFVEPNYPFSTILIVHNTLNEKAKLYPLLDENGKPRQMRIAYSRPAAPTSSPGGFHEPPERL